MISKDNIKDTNIAVIGAGLAGSMVAHRLTNSGFKVTVFDKSRGTGGRHAACRLESDSADLGAPYFDATDTSFSEWLSDQQHIVEWQPHFEDFEGRVVKNQSLHAALPRQSALTRSLLQGSELVTSTRVGYIWPEINGVLLRDEEGNPIGHFDKVIVATPAPQAAPLLEANASFVQRAQSVKTIPSWVMVVSLARPTGVKADVLQGRHPILARATRDSAKPGRKTSEYSEIWSIEANGDWSEANKNAERDVVAAELLKAFQSLITKPLDVAHSRTHRWLYARHLSESDKTYLWSDDTSIGACGDWLHGKGGLHIAGSQDAWNSANALADQLINQHLDL